MYGVIQTFTDPDYMVVSNWSRACFSPDNRTIIAGSNDRSLILWDALTGQTKSKLTGHEGPVYNVHWVAGTGVDGAFRIASGDKVGKVCLWS